jgi:hypothetical protein
MLINFTDNVIQHYLMLTSYIEEIIAYHCEFRCERPITDNMWLRKKVLHIVFLESGTP